MYSFPNVNPLVPSPLASVVGGGGGHQPSSSSNIMLNLSLSSSIPSLASLGSSSLSMNSLQQQQQQLAGRGTSSIKHTSSALIKQYRSLTKQLFDGLVLQLSSNLPSAISNANSPTIVDIMNRIVEVDANLQKCIKERTVFLSFPSLSSPLLIVSFLFFFFLESKIAVEYEYRQARMSFSKKWRDVVEISMNMNRRH